MKDTLVNWWEAEDGDIYESVMPLVEKIREDNTERHDNFMRYAMLYGSGFASDYSFGRQGRVNKTFTPGPKMSVNIVKSQVDTLRSKITKNKPRAMFLTDGGEWSLRIKSKKLNKFMEGMFNEYKIHDIMSETFLDAAVTGIGALKIYNEGANIHFERVFSGELDVDSADAIDGKPRSLHQTKMIQREVLIGMFPEFEAQIDELEDDDMELRGESQVQLVRCVESWHLKNKAGKGGRHSICIKTADLFSEVYKADDFPFAFFRMGSNVRGFWGHGLSAQLEGIQLEINKVLRNIQIALHLSVPKVLLPMGSKVQVEALNNKIGGIIKYSGNVPPTYTQLMSVPGEYWQHLDWLIARAFETTGISQLSAQSKKPGGLDSGKALQTFNDIETERFLVLGRNYETFALDISERILGIVAKNKSITAKFKDGDSLEIIPWKDVDLKKDLYEIDIFPVSSLPSDPSAKFQTIQEFVQAGMIPPQEAMRLLDFPDLSSFLDKESAQQDNIEKIIGKIVEDGDYIIPDSFINLDMLIGEAQKAVVYYELRNLPEKRLDLLRLLIDDAQNILLGAQDMEAQQAEEAMMEGQEKAHEEGIAEIEGMINEAGLDQQSGNVETVGQAPQTPQG